MQPACAFFEAMDASSFLRSVLTCREAGRRTVGEA
jgi:hypothetical protein